MTESRIGRAHCSQNVSNVIFRAGVPRAILFYFHGTEDVAQMRPAER